MRRIVSVLIPVFLATLTCLPQSLAGCGARVPREAQQEGGWRCPPVPETFQESDLVGTWQSRYHSGLVTDTLTLREDGTYQQVYENDLADYYYTSPWNRWYVEYRPSGGLYLHLEWMHYCLRTDAVCRGKGGGGDWPYRDDCEDRSIRDMGDEVILTVRGSEGFRYPSIESVPRGIILVHMRSGPEVPDNFFILRE